MFVRLLQNVFVIIILSQTISGQIFEWVVTGGSAGDNEDIYDIT